VTTVATMVSRIENSLNRGSSFTSQINSSIIDAVKYYKPRRFTFNTGRATASTVDGQEYYALPNDCIEVDMMTVTYSSNNVEYLDETTYRWIQRNTSDTTRTSQPDKFAIEGLDLRMWPVPDGVYTLTMTYLRDIGGFSATLTSTLSNAWTDEAEELIRSRAMAALLQDTIGGPDAEAASVKWVVRERQKFNELRREANRRESSGRLIPYL